MCVAAVAVHTSKSRLYRELCDLMRSACVCVLATHSACADNSAFIVCVYALRSANTKWLKDAAADDPLFARTSVSLMANFAFELVR